MACLLGIQQSFAKAELALAEVAGWALAGAGEVLDYGHGAEHLCDGAKAVFGVDNAAAQSQAARGRLRLLEDGYWGVTEWVGEVAAQVPGGDGAALGGMLNYFAAHQTR